MSFESWLAEFYPDGDNKIIKISEGKDKQQQDYDAIEHSLTKWRGLTVESLKKHNCILTMYRGYLTVTDEDNTPHDLSDSNTLNIASTSCALCKIHLDSDDDYNCDNCPLFLKDKGCNIHKENPWDLWYAQATEGSTYTQEYNANYTNQSNPEKMIDALSELLTEINEKRSTNKQIS